MCQRAKQDLKDKLVYNLIYKTNDLNGLVYEIKKAGYEPKFKNIAGTITLIKLRFFGKLFFNIRSHNLLNDDLHGSITVETEEIFNTMDKAFNNLKSSILQSKFKSYYSETVAILDGCRTIVNSGIVAERNAKSMVEIDIRNSFTHALT